MQVNPTSAPQLTHFNQLKRVGAAMTIASAHTGISLPRAPASDPASTGACLVNLFHLACAEGPAQSTAAAALLVLALEGTIMLPFDGPAWRAISPQDFPFDVPPFLLQVDDYVKGEAPRWLGSDRHFNLLLATDCRRADTFSIRAYAELHSWLMGQGLVDSKLSLSAAPYLTLRGVELAQGSALGRDLRHGYIIWRGAASDKTMDFAKFMEDPKNMSGMRVHGHARERVELHVHLERRRALELQRKARAKAQRASTPFVQNLLDIVEGNNPDAPERYFGDLTGGSNVKGFRPDYWLHKPVNYPGRVHVDVAKLGAKWFTAFRAFLLRRQKDHDTDDQVRSALCVLADYVLLYLPWWMERHPDTTLELPTSPKMFLRYYYVDRTRFHADEEIDLADLPKTFYELLSLRRPTASSRNTIRSILQKFFGFVVTYFEDSSDYVDRRMQNPIRTDFDNEVAGRPGKTNKVPFAEDVFPFLVHYGQAVEAFGEFLQQEAYELNIFRELPNGSRQGYDTADWGYVPIFWYRGRLYRVEWLPNMYLVSKRILQANPASQSGLYVQGRRINRGIARNVTINFPHLTTMRLLSAMVETGLRAQSVQWLDRKTFDSLARPVRDLSELHGNASLQGYHSLFINTDKTHEEWQNLASWRVRRSLLAERHFQDSTADAKRDVSVPYEGRELSRFGKVLPLFRSDRSSKPVSDSLYTRRWVEFLYGFQMFYNRKDGVDRSDSADAVEVLEEREDWEEGASIVDTYSAIHTPHACRATYATLKDGDLEISEIAEQLGHSNTTVTNTYQVPRMKRLLGKLKEIDTKMMGSTEYDPSGAGSAYLHPEHENSPVRVAFGKNRAQAISDFGFIPGVAMWSLSELDGDSSTLDLLRQSPASVIRWHATHACPVGNQCPKEVVANAGGLNRCGICPLAAKCVDHLPAIEAAQTEFHERIKSAGNRLRHLQERGASQTELDAQHRAMEMDTKELLGWKLSAEILRARQSELAVNGTYHVDQPELVRKQLELVTRNRSESEFFLQRISDANAYPSLESPEVRAKAARFTRLILAKEGKLEEAAFLDVPAHSELTVFASTVKPYVDAKNVSLEELAGAIDELPRVVALSRPSVTPLLQRE